MIIKDEISVGEKLPSEKQLSEEFEVNRLTVRMAINKLNTLGILETKTGKGTYVKQINLYNYINQILPFVISTQNTEHILDLEREVLSLDFSDALNENDIEKILEFYKCTEREVEILSRIYDIDKRFDDAIVNNIANYYWEIKKIVVSRLNIKFIKSIYLSLEEYLIEYDTEYIKSMSKNNIDDLLKRLDFIIEKINKVKGK